MVTIPHASSRTAYISCGGPVLRFTYPPPGVCPSLPAYYLCMQFSTMHFPCSSTPARHIKDPSTPSSHEAQQENNLIAAAELWLACTCRNGVLGI